MTPRAALLFTLALLPPAAQAGDRERPDSLERETARMLLVGARGAEHKTGDEFEKLICGIKVGGLLLFERDVERDGAPRNIRSKEQLTKLTSDLHELARSCGDAPLLIAVDIEGGVVNRLSRFPELKKVLSHARLGRGDARRTYDEARRIGQAMSSSGLNWTLAPVIDVNLNPENPAIGRHGRSFSEDPEAVTRHAHAFIRGLRSFGVLNCVKHFPGHGSSTMDSHLGAVDVTNTSRPEVELLPYRTLIDRGIVDCVMTAHIYDRKVDPQWIVTFSSRAIEGTLRGDIGFEGVVISDDLQMQAITRHYRLTEAAIRAVQAGSDMIIVSNNRDPYDEGQAEKVLEALMEAARDGRIPRRRISEASERILRMKSKLASEHPSGASQ